MLENLENFFNKYEKIFSFSFLFFEFSILFILFVLCNNFLEKRIQVIEQKLENVVILENAND